MEKKISELAQSIYKEGIEKAEEESRLMIEKAEEKSKQIIADAEEKAGSILVEADQKAKDLKKNTDAEVKLSCQQAVAGLKSSIIDIVLSKVVDQPMNSLLADPKLLKDFLLEVLKNWKTDGKDAPDLNVLLPESMRKDLDNLLTGSVNDLFGKGIQLTFSDSVQSGFQLAPKGGSFKISMTDEDFAEFFKAYLRPRTRKIVFG